MRTLTRPSALKAFPHSPLVAAIGLALSSLGVGAATFTVSNNGDFTTGSLRDAIGQANANCGAAPHVIEFSGAFVISPSMALPAVTCPQVTINATQRTDVTISGQFAYGGSCAMTSTASTVVHRLTVRDFTYGTGFCGSVHAINNVVANNQLGMSLGAGGYAYGNQLSGNADGIVVADAVTVDSNTINSPPGADGIITQFGYGGATIRNNTVNGGFYGMVLYDAPLVEGNTVAGAEYGISVNGPGMVVKANTARDNIYYGIIANNRARIEGNFVTGSFTGIELQDADAIGNYVGSVAGGTSNDVGIYDWSGGVAGGALISGNVIGGNTGTGLLLEGYGGTVSGNYIGTNAAGTGALSNAVGIHVSSFAYGYFIDDNVISGNQGSGIFIEDAFELVINGNRIGTTADGSTALGNGSVGIDIPCGGQTTSISGNIISGNAAHGISLAGFQGSSIDGMVDGNRIGVAATGLNPAAIPNQGNGVILDVKSAFVCGSAPSDRAKLDTPKGRLLQAKLAKKALRAATAKALLPKATYNFDETNQVPVVGNIIAFNLGAGIQAVGGQGNYWYDNRIWANGGKNIDLNGGAALPNDDGDGDGGPNLKQNAPEIVSVRQTPAGETVVDFKLKTEPITGGPCPASPPLTWHSYSVDFYENAGPSTPAGQYTISGASTIFDGTACEVTTSVTIPGLHDHVSAIARNETDKNSSEFSNVVAAVAAPAVSVAPSSFAFGDVPVGTTASRTVTLTSVGGQPYRITSFGTDPTCGRAAFSKFALAACSAPFTCDTTCAPETDYPNGASCSVTATFTPAGLGGASQTLYLCDNAQAAGQPIALAGNGTPSPVVTLAPATWDFGSMRAGTKSAFKAFSVVNQNGAAVTISSITASGDFIKESTTCPVGPATLAAGAGCEVLVSFLPTGSGPVTGTLTIASGGGGFSNATSALLGSGVTVAEIILPASVDFGAYTVGAAPIVRTVTFTNTGNVDVVFSSITAGAPFTLSNGCGTNLAAGASCTLTLSFAPSAVGTYSATLAIASNASGGSGNVPLTGTAQAAPVPLATLSTGNLDLGTTPLGSTSDPGTITVTSTGTAAYVVTRYSADSSCTVAAPVCSAGEFLCSLGCDPGVAYAPGSSCTITARFAPTGLGVRSTTFFICDNTTASPRAVTITGEATNPVVVDMAPRSHAFGTVQLGQASEPQSFTVVNAGGRPVPISAPVTTGSFRVASHNCPATLNAAQRCIVSVVFAPTFAGAAAGQLIIQAGSGAALSSAVATLSGIGGTQPVLELPATLDFGSTQVGAGSVTRTATLTNSGNSPLTLASVTLSGVAFTLQNDCPSTVAPGASCALRVTFTPTASGEFSGGLTVVGNAAGGPRTVQLIARAQPQPTPLVRVSPGSMGFGDRQIGSTGATQRVTVSNVGGAAAAIDRITVGLDYVVASNTCGGGLPAQQSCVIEIALRPIGFGPRPGQLLIVTNADGSPHTVNLSGTGCRPYSSFGRNSGRNAACAP